MLACHYSNIVRKIAGSVNCNQRLTCYVLYNIKFFMTWNAIRQPTTFIPLAMSLAALITLGIHIAIYGAAREPDEGTAAHIWQLLMAGELPVIAFYAVKWLPQAPKQALPVLGAQFIAALAALAPVYLLGLQRHCHFVRV